MASGYVPISGAPLREDRDAIRILIADDHTIFRDGLKELMSREPGFDVVGEAGDGYDALALAGNLNPDVLLLDVQMPGISGMEVLRRLANSGSPVKTLLVSGVVNAEETLRAFEFGVRGVVLKDSATRLLFEGIRAVSNGYYWVGQQATSRPGAEGRFRRSGSGRKMFGLSPREMQVLRAVVSGRQNKEIAALLKISEQTVKHHVTSIFDKTGVYNRLELTLFAFHHNLID